MIIHTNAGWKMLDDLIKLVDQQELDKDILKALSFCWAVDMRNKIRKVMEERKKKIDDILSILF